MRNINKRMFGLAVAATLTSLFVSSQAFASDGADAMKFVPEDTMFVMSVNVERFRDSPLYADLLAAVTADKEAQEMLKMLKDGAGFDIEKDLNTIVIAAPPEVMSTEEFIVIAEGNFDEKKFVAFAKEQGGDLVAADHAGQSYYEIDKKGGIVFYDDFLIAGPKALVQEVIEVEKGKANALSANTAMTELMDSADTSKDLWFAVELSADLQKELSAQMPTLGDIEAVNGSLDLASGLGLDLLVATASADSAKEIAELINQGIQEAAKDQTVAQLGLDGAVKGIKVDTDGTTIGVSLALTADELEVLQKTLEGLIGGMIR